jgi:hypothetical protein
MGSVLKTGVAINMKHVINKEFVIKKILPQCSGRKADLPLDGINRMILVY